MRLPKYQNRYRAQVLISVLISLALFIILSQALFTLLSTSYSITTYNRARNVGKHLAQEKIEEIRNMPYSQIGTVGGIPSGDLLQNETVQRNGLNYQIVTSIVYIDDQFDQLAPADLLATDYKRIKIDISWEGLTPSRGSPITIITDISPAGIETTTGGGTLSILVFDANAQPVSGATVTIQAGTTPAVDLNLDTDVNGRVILPGAPPCTNSCYQISVTKEGYSTDRTYSVAEVVNPDKPNLSIYSKQLSEISFAIDKLSTITAYSYKDRENNFESLSNISFNIRGEKIIGTDSDDSPVYKYEDIFVTGSDGKVTIPDLEWDNYQITVDSATGWDISGITPYHPIGLTPDTQIDLKFALTGHTTNNVLVVFTDPADTQIASVSANLYDASTLVASASSGIATHPDFGESFFSSLDNKIYNLVATASGFINFNGTLDIVGYKEEKIIMTPE
ncbi:hypothetical protein A3A76_04225 [Candidatus Woesebacteria bacterium RIFCSPLOWO2_01_FULL_39_23]|uniref:Carboxypeptidase regulatory-like domain-containing protein n=1 Tax=Candidatus Woesebacteria bacterium RIFCSPHIGHO2_01_FULL_40_22 TaxID=1802499 RepID=A0A1F7YGE8_9BACT|nr:MAG: hypothetical protein A2628_00225 [Candidatus Woesebacteria bacterium RIFCSPHIGHO2_01_FULL_40_22]OGM38072.1 MAG: hypothetical protein A3E41_03315 [Candidatus Woesebacteria bacterium RIFCSPHIGHO2_12_FULL_38_9]OGM61808.1 MAG: hypothetical protein A3A76_04225 [Candidatus Woesebacteria bacterium RIFCSPLOWO2_01_FULL_39_23]